MVCRLHWRMGVALAGALLASRAAAQPNLAPNPGFEEGVAGAPAGWSVADPGPNARAEWATEAHGGSRSLAGLVGKQPGMVWWNCAPIDVEPGQTYALTVWYRCTNGSGGPATLQVQAADGSNLIDWNLPVRTEWSRFTQSVTLRAEDRQVRIALINYYRVGQGVYWDDVSLREAYPPEGDAASREVAVAPTDAAQTEVGARPYELGHRKPDFPPSVCFSDLPGWRVRLGPGTSASAAVSAQQRIWGKRCLRVRYQWTAVASDPFLSSSGLLAGKQGGGWLEIVPPAPIPIRQPFDAVQLWVNADHYYSPHQPQVAVRLLDGDGKAVDVVLGPVNWMSWFLMYSPTPQHLTLPVTVDRLIVSNLTNPTRLDLYVDALAFIETPKGPIPSPQWRQPLPFPTRPETILPSVREPVSNRLYQEGDAFVFDCATADGPVTYRYEPRTGTLSDVVALVPGEGIWQPLSGGGPVLVDSGSPDGREGVARLVSAGVEGDSAVTVWELGGPGQALQVTYRLRVWGKSLVIDATADRPLVASFSAGRIVGAPRPRVFWPPYANCCRWPQPHVLITDSHFASVYLDWYNTASSAFWGAGDCSAAGVRIFDRAEYQPDLGGTRHRLNERLFLTVSTHVDEVLWTIPNPPSPLQDVLRTNLYVTRMHYGGGAADYDSEFAFWQGLKRYGVDHLTIRLHADFWRSRESFTLKDVAAPAKGGDRVARRYLRRLRGLGYRVGLYTDYLLISPLCESWNPDMAALTPDGDRAEQAFATYFLKPTQAPRMQALWAPRIHAKFRTSASYCDQITLANPGWIDFDSRVAGAAQQRTVLQNWGRLLLNERVAHAGPCYSEGGYHAVWAGLCDGSYAQTLQPDAPLMPEFALRRIHSLEADVGYDLAWLDEDLDRLLSLQIGYGSVGMFWGAAYSRDVPQIQVPLVLRSYFMMQQLQYRYTLEPVAAIRYFDGADWVDADAALRGAAGRRGQVLTTYRNGLVVAVNANATESLSMLAAGRRFRLPPRGWLATGPDDFLEYSALSDDGSRRDFVRSAAYVYFDGRGSLGGEGGIETAGQVIVRRAGASLHVVAVAPVGPVRLHLPTLGLGPTPRLGLRYRAGSGKAVSTARQPWPADGQVALSWPPEAFSVDIGPE